MPQEACLLDTTITKQVRLSYLLHLPTGYGEKEQRWPLILFLHGMGERGDQLALVKRHGIPKIAEEWSDFPFVAVSPQCPADSTWALQHDALLALLDDILARYAVDPGRVYLTGLSMGGYGTWELASAHPERFAAIAPICGGGTPFLGFPARVCTLKDVPVWAFHGAKDTVVPLGESEKMVAALRACGGNVRFTVYPEAGHDAWTETYANPELYAWFLSHHR